MSEKPTYEELEQRIQELEQAESKQKRAEKSQRESEEKYKLITETSQTGIYIHQNDIIMYANDRFAKLHGYTVDELIGTNYFNLFHPDERERALGIKSKRLRGDEDAPQFHETKRVKKDGEILWCQTVAVRIEFQEKPAIMGNVVDITERKLTEEQRDRFVLKLQDTLTRVETLSAISQTVNQSLNLDQVLSEAMERIMELFKPHSAHIRLLDKQTQELVLAVQKGLTPEDLKKLPKRLKLEEAISRDAIKSHKAVIIEDILTHPRTAGKQSFAEKIGCRTLVTLPLLSKNKILGHMSIRGREPSAFTADEIQLFTSIGHQVGTAIENASLFSQIQQNKEALEALYSVSNAVSQTLDIEKLTGVVLDKVIEVLHCDAGTIRLLDETNQTLEIIAHKGFSVEQAKKINIKRKYGEGLAWRCLESNQVVFTEFDPNDSYQQKIKSFGMRIEARSAIHFPIVQKDVKQGIITIYSFSFREFQRGELELCASIGHQIGIAIENARLYQQAQNNIKALKDAQEEREKIIVELQKALTEVKKLSGLLPICSHCKNIRDDKGYWKQIENYIHEHLGADFTHSICPACAKKYYPEYNIYDD
ncbi:MAG: GAF domain-containing protein [Desulfobacterales bacterium]|nr:GAF domain-containing protein [Desulfobacterales bacterium]